MTGEKRQTPDYSTFAKYQYGALAARLAASKENSRYISSALELLAGSKGLNLGEEALGFIKGTQASEKGIQTAIEVYGSKFEEERGKYEPIDMAAWYDSVLKDLSNEEKEKILGELSKHGETIEKIEEKHAKAEYILKAPEGLFTKEQIAEAKKTIEKYQNVLAVMQNLDNYKFEELRPEAVSTFRKQELKGLASKL